MLLNMNHKIMSMQTLDWVQFMFPIYSFLGLRLPRIQLHNLDIACRHVNWSSLISDAIPNIFAQCPVEHYIERSDIWYIPCGSISSEHKDAVDFDECHIFPTVKSLQPRWDSNTQMGRIQGFVLRVLLAELRDHTEQMLGHFT